MTHEERILAKRAGLTAGVLLALWLCMLTACGGIYWMLVEGDFLLGSIGCLISVALLMLAVWVGYGLLRKQW